MFKRKSIVILLLVAITMIAYFGYNYIYKEHRNIENEEATYSLNVIDLDEAYTKSLEGANAKYLDQTIVVSGQVTLVDLVNNSVMIDSKISCHFNEMTNIKENAIVTIKGRFIGYDELLEEYKLDECSISIN